MAAWDELVSGQLFKSFMTPITSIIGTEMFYIFIWISVMGILIVKTRDWGLVMIALMITSAIFIPLILPSISKFIMIFIVAGMVYYMYSIFKSK